MAYENPRPSAPELGSTLPEVLNDNLTTLDLLTNSEDQTITNRKGNELLTADGFSQRLEDYLLSLPAIEEAPNDGQVYVRVNQSWVVFTL